ncbi:flagellar protein FlbD [Paenibacillus taihuensis]|uniref:Flagellar protein FlbD n=1 Tax=Paenibacillus taihuensis TaxID=1156355 RepID=A0A3D9SKN3_9BACL|nr:flagellar FlbD family protein [Paenibacillus taihuensis]REE94423.1 flagellar protein FlbD [Paenibacillus taihuensis]
MIAVTRLNGRTLHINALLIEIVEETPDTLITLTTGKKILVLEKATEVISSIQSYLRSIGVYAATLKSDLTEGQSQ